MDGRGSQIPPVAEELLQAVDGCWGGGVRVLQGCSLTGHPHSADGPAPVCIQAEPS